MKSPFSYVPMLLVAALGLAPSPAGATVHKEGAWPAEDTKVSFSFDGKPSQGVQRLGKEAGWSLVVSDGIAVSEHDVHIRVEDQPADAVLDALFAQSNVIAKRSGTLVTVLPAPAGSAATATATAPATAPSAAAPAAEGAVAAAAAATATATATATAAPAAPPVPTVRGEDRSVVGTSLHVQKDEIVRTVTATGGSAKIDGTVTGDLVVAGGSATITGTGRVVGNVSVVAGSVHLERGARVDGDVGVVGGSLERAEGSFIGGAVVDGAGGPGTVKVKDDDGHVTAEVEPSEGSGSRAVSALHAFGRRLTNMSLLFVLGCVLLALATQRMETLRIEAAARPMRTFAMGVVSSIAAAFVVLIACVTIVGIPFAIVATLCAVLATYGSIAAVLTTLGAAVLQHKTKSPYVHLLFGCAVLLVVGAIPYIGGLLTFVLVMIAIGALVSTRGGQLDVRRTPALT